MFCGCWNVFAWRHVHSEAQFWDGVSSWFAYAEHPVAHFDDRSRSKTILFAIHGDGYPILGVGKAWSMSSVTWSFTSLLARGETILFYLVVCILYQESLANNTVEHFLSVLAWSFLWMERGVYPTTDANGAAFPPDSDGHKMAGKPLAEGWRGTLFLLLGDLEYVAKFLRLEHFGSLKPCFFMPVQQN